MATVAAAVVAAVSGVAWATIPDSNTGQISACYPTSGATKGQLRVIDAQAGATCAAGEASVSWQKNGLRWKGAWSPTTAYALNDLVTFGRTRQAFVAIAASTAKRPADTGTTWRVLGGGTGMTPGQVGSLAWWQDPARPATVTVGTGPRGVAFDGSALWITNSGSNNVSKINPTTNTVIATVTVGTGPVAVAFDGTNIWVANNGSNNVSKINPTTNTVIATVFVGLGPAGLAYDGTNIWVSNYNAGTVKKINPTTNAITATVIVGTGTEGLAFDGTSLWVANSGNLTLSKINTTTNTVSATLTFVDGYPVEVAYDGINIWVTVRGGVNGFLKKINPTTNAVLDTITVSPDPEPYGVAFDGKSIWVVNNTAGTVSRIDPFTDAVTATLNAGSGPWGIAFDGTNLWVANEGTTTVSKLRP